MYCHGSNKMSAILEGQILKMIYNTQFIMKNNCIKTEILQYCI